MNFPKLATLSGLAAISWVTASPAHATWHTHNDNEGSSWSSSGGWHVSGWGSSGWASSSFGVKNPPSTSPINISASSSSGGSSSGGTPVPEPSNMLMLALGVAGLVAGRFAARRKRKK